MRAVTLFFWNLKPTQSIHRFALPFLTYMVDLTFGKIFNILEESQQINYLGIYIYYIYNIFYIYNILLY